MTPQELVKKFKLDKLHWLRKGYHGVLHVHFPVTRTGFEIQKFFGRSHNFIVDFFDGEEHGDWNMCYEDSVRIRDLFLARVKKDPKYLDKLEHAWKKSVKNLLKIFDVVRKSDLSRLSNEELFKLYEEFNQAYAEEFALGIGIQDPFTLTTNEFLRPHFREVSDEDYTILTQPATLSFVKMEAVDLARLRLKKVTDRLLQQHSDKYFWIHSNYAYIPWLDKEYFRRQLAKLNVDQARTEIDNTEKNLAESKKKKSDLIRKLKLKAWSKTLIRIVEVFAYMQDERKKYSMMANNGIDLFMKEYGKRLKLSYEDMKYTYVDELPKLLTSNPKQISELLKKRKVASGIIATREGTFVYEGQEAQKLHALIFGKQDNDVEQIQGMVASRGHTRGTVRVILTFHDLSKMKQGDIIVASMTRPEMVSAMQKASAIVTDEGGITCHAAIISRELGIPCVIGTKIATKIFKDGDMVEVDANKGIVRKI